MDGGFLIGGVSGWRVCPLIGIRLLDSLPIVGDYTGVIIDAGDGTRASEDG